MGLAVAKQNGRFSLSVPRVVRLGQRGGGYIHVCIRWIVVGRERYQLQWSARVPKEKQCPILIKPGTVILPNDSDDTAHS